MYTEVFSNIDTLIEMAGASSNVDEENTLLIGLKKQIKDKKNEIDELKSLMTDSRYFNASNELVDKNIEISLKNKITRLSRKLKEIEEKTASINEEEMQLHEDIKGMKKKLRKNEIYVQVLEEKAGTSKTNQYYQDLLKEEKENVVLLTKLLEEKTKDYEAILHELELNNQATLELKNKLAKEEERLNDVLDNLKNPNTYLDEDLKSSDEEKLHSLTKELEELEKKELTILTDAGVIGSDAKEFIAQKHIREAMDKIKELVTIVKSKPYMDVSNLSVLEEELEKKESLRIELSNLIDNKNYEGISSDAIVLRIEYLNQEITNKKEEIGKLENEINKMDEFINHELGSKISSLEKEVLQNEEILKEYRDLLKEKNQSFKTKTNLEQAITRKEKMSQVLDGILFSYKEDLMNKIKETNELRNKVDELNEFIQKREKELEGLQKLTLINFQTKDIMDEEKDKNELQKLNEEIKEIKDRQKYEKTPNEIFDQIEMLLSAISPLEEENKEGNLEKPQVELVEQKEEQEELKNNRIKVIEMIPVETVKSGGGSNHGA